VANADARVVDVERMRDPERREARISALYRAAQAAMAVGNWAVALERLTHLLLQEPGHQEAVALAQRVRRQQEVPDLYSKGREHHDAGRWRAALDYFRQVQEIAGNYRGVFALMATAQHEIERAEALRGSETAPAPLRIAERSDSPLVAHYKQVIKAVIDGRVVPFLGADINLCGRPVEEPWRHGQYLPTHTELAAYLAESFDDQWSDVPDLARVSQHVTIMTGTRPLYIALRDLYDRDYPPTPVHQFLATLPGALRATGHAPRYQLIVTTTYDDVLERAFQAAGEPFDLVSYAVEGPCRGKFVHYPPGAEARMIDRPNEYRGLSLDQRTVILKLHGAVDRGNPERDSYVITEDNYITYLTRLDVSSLLPVTLLAKLRTSHVLFLGYSLREWHQRVIVHRLWGEQKLSDNYKCWALHVDVQPIDREFWSKRDVAILPVRPDEYMAVLSARVQALARVGTGA
jgi:SIR2-like domain